MTPPIRQRVSGAYVHMNADEMNRFPSRKNPRLRHFDYSSPHYYFVTICTWEKRCLFWNSGELNQYGHIAKQGFEEMTAHFPGVEVDKYVVMPNHVHGILILNGHTSNLSTVVGLYKSYVTKQVHSLDSDCRVWQTSFYDHVIRNQKDYARIWLYIEGNPARWKEDCFFHEQAVRK